MSLCITASDDGQLTLSEAGYGGRAGGEDEEDGLEAEHSGLSDREYLGE